MAKTLPICQSRLSIRWISPNAPLSPNQILAKPSTPPMPTPSCHALYRVMAKAVLSVWFFSLAKVSRQPSARFRLRAKASYVRPQGFAPERKALANRPQGFAPKRKLPTFVCKVSLKSERLSQFVGKLSLTSDDCHRHKNTPPAIHTLVFCRVF